MKKLLFIILSSLSLFAMAYQFDSFKTDKQPIDVEQSSNQEDSIHNKLNIDTYLESNPECLSIDVVFEGCNLLLSSDGEELFTQLNIHNPELQMRFLMQGVTFYIDPTGKKKEKFEITFSSGMDVKECLTPPETPNENIDSSDEQARPDIRPLLYALNQNGTNFGIGNKKINLPEGSYSISINEDDDCLSYSFLIPVETLLQEKKLTDNWSICIYSPGGIPSQGSGGPGMGGPGMGGPGMGGPGMGGPGMGGPGMGGPGMGGPGMNKPNKGLQGFSKNNKNPNNEVQEAQDIRSFMMNDIEVWYKFSFPQINSIN